MMSKAVCVKSPIFILTPNVRRAPSSYENDFKFFEVTLCPMRYALCYFLIDINHSNPFDKAFQNLDKTVGSRFAQNQNHSDFNFFSSPSSNNLDAENPHTLITLH